MPGPNAVMWCRPRSFPASAGLSRRMIPPPPQKLARPPAPDRKTDDAAGPDQAGGFAGIINPNAEVVIVEIADSAIGARHLCRFNSRMFWCVRTAAVVATLMRPEGRAPQVGLMPASEFGLNVAGKRLTSQSCFR